MAVLLTILSQVILLFHACFNDLLTGCVSVDLAVIQVRVIFQLPSPFRTTFAQPLVYVHWFKELRDPVEGIEMCLTSLSSRNRRPRASIIPLADILQTCHLIPVYGSRSATTLRWSPSSIITEAPSFYLNPYLRHHDFHLLRYRVDKFQEAQRVREENAHRMRRLTHG